MASMPNFGRIKAADLSTNKSLNKYKNTPTKLRGILAERLEIILISFRLRQELLRYHSQTQQHRHQPLLYRRQLHR